MSVHTPTPWRTEETESRIWIGTPKGESKLDRLILGIDIDGLKAEVIAQKRTDADFIVRAVNCHDELVAALKKALDQFHYEDASDAGLLHPQNNSAQARRMMVAGIVESVLAKTNS